MGYRVAKSIWAKDDEGCLIEGEEVTFVLHEYTVDSECARVNVRQGYNHVGGYYL